MNHKRNIIVVGLLVLAIILGLWLLPVREQTTGNVLAEENSESPSSTESTSASTSSGELDTASNARELGRMEMERRAEERRQEVVERVINSLNTPISFYGRVVDQNGEPVADAEIIYNAADKFMESGSDYQGESDTNGYFTLSGVKGATLGVGVRKKGYYQIYGKSNAYFAYGVGVDSDRKAPPTKDNPAIFILHKTGVTVQLFNLKKDVLLPKNGTPIEVNLLSWHIAELGQGDIKVEAWTEDEGGLLKERYNWKCRITVPGGGLVERVGEFSFEAPEVGYQPNIEISMSADAERWSGSAERDYFLKLPDNRFARISFIMVAHGSHFFALDSYLNPVPNDRNLESDPDKLVEIRPR